MSEKEQLMHDMRMSEQFLQEMSFARKQVVKVGLKSKHSKETEINLKDIDMNKLKPS